MSARTNIGMCLCVCVCVLSFLYGDRLELVGLSDQLEVVRPYAFILSRVVPDVRNIVVPLALKIGRACLRGRFCGGVRRGGYGAWGTGGARGGSE